MNSDLSYASLGEIKALKIIIIFMWMYFIMKFHTAQTAHTNKLLIMQFAPRAVIAISS